VKSDEISDILSSFLRKLAGTRWPESAGRGTRIPGREVRRLKVGGPREEVEG
jgi:hypothetical protein